MIVACILSVRDYWGVWGHIPTGKILNLDPLRLQSGTNFPNDTYILATIITILNFKISAGEGGNSRALTPLYETLTTLILVAW